MGFLEIEGKVDLVFQKFFRMLMDDLCEMYSMLFFVEIEIEIR